MGFSFDDSEDQLRYEERGSNAVLRAALAVVGVAAIASSYVFIDIIASMGPIAGAAKMGGLMASILAVIAFCLFGGYCLRLALLVPRQTVVFDKVQQQLVCIAHTPLLGRREQKYGLDAISSMDIAENSSEDGPASFTVVVAVSSAKPILMGVFQEHAQASSHLRQICRAVGRPNDLLRPPSTAL